MKKTFLSVLILILILVGHAQDLVFEKITTQKGLSQNDVNCIFQDRRGFLWIGTNDGLNRYDGYSFRTFRVDKAEKEGVGLSSNLIFKVAEDHNGDLWIASSNEGVCKFDVEKETFVQFRNTPKNPGLIADNRIVDMKCMDDGTIWTTSMKGVDIFSLDNGKVSIESLAKKLPESFNEQRFISVAQDRFGRIWLGKTNGMILLTNVDGKYQVQSFPEFEGTNIKKVLPVGEGLLVASNKGVYFLKEYVSGESRFFAQQLSTISARDLLLDKNNTLYVASNQGLYVFKCELSGKVIFELVTHAVQGFTESSLNRNIVMSLYEDLSGNIWVGTNGGGLNKYNPNRKKFYHFKATGLPGSLSNNKIRSIFEDSQKNIWIGTEGGGVNRLDHRKNRDFDSGFESYYVGSSVYENNGYTFVEHEFGGQPRIWVGSGYPKLLLQYDLNGKMIPPVGDKFYPPISSPVFSTLKDRDGNIWLGTYGSSGLYKYVPKDDGYQLFNFQSNGNPGEISSNIIRNILQDKDGNIWIATDTGLDVLAYREINKENPYFKVFRNDEQDVNSLSNNYVLALFESSAGDLWVGTMGGGLNKVTKNASLTEVRFEYLSTSDGLPNDVIKGILEDENGNLWISSNKGLSRYNPSTGSIMNYDINDGLQDHEFGELACCKLDDGMMLFGGVNGFNAFYPEQIGGDTIAPRVVFTELQVLNRPVAVGDTVNNRVMLESVINETDQIKLKYSENSFAIYFSALHFTAPLKNKYKYMLEGFDAGWILKNSTERFAKYTSLRPGKYKFKLFTSNNDGVWTKEPKVLTIIVVPPWWQSNIAIVLYVILLILVLWFFQRYSIIRIKQKNELLMEHFEKEKIEELAQMKLRFFTNISHEFRTPLTLIIGAVQKLIKTSTDLPDEVEERYRTIQRNSSLMLRLINQLMDFRKMEQDKVKLAVSSENLVPLVKDIYSSFKELALNKNITFNFNAPSDLLQVWVDVDKIEKILYNLLSNAFKFTPNGGNIDLTIQVTDYDVIISVKDDGVGIPQKMQSHIFERFYQATKLKGPNFSGTGIGLSYSKGLAQMHYGDIRFTSKEEEGSCFELVLKRGNAHFHPTDYLSEQEKSRRSVFTQTSEEVLMPMEPRKPAEPIAADSKKYTLLIVEDNPDLLNFLADSFGNEFNIRTAENGQVGLQVAAESEIDLIISDVAMPVKTGFELCQEIKSDEKTSHIPVVLLTAKSTSEDTIIGYQVGADAYVIKPFNIDVLEAQVKSILTAREELKDKFKKSIEVNPSEVTTTNADEKFLSKLLAIIEDNIINSEFSVEQLANEYGLSQIIINKKLKSLTGHTANSFIRNVRLKRACQLLKTGRYTVADVTYEVGFSDLKYFRSCFKKEYNVTPSEYIKQEKSE